MYIQAPFVEFIRHAFPVLLSRHRGSLFHSPLPVIACNMLLHVFTKLAFYSVVASGYMVSRFKASGARKWARCTGVFGLPLKVNTSHEVVSE